MNVVKFWEVLKVEEETNGHKVSQFCQLVFCSKQLNIKKYRVSEMEICMET